MLKHAAILNRKITIAVLIVSVGLSLALTAAQTFHAWKVSSDRLATALDRQVFKLEKSLAVGAWYMDRIHIQTSLEQLSSDAGVTGVAIVLNGKDGIFAQTGDITTEGTTLKTWSIRSPLPTRQEEIATLQVYSSTVVLKNEILSAAMFLLVTNALKGLLASIIFLYIIDRLVSQPLRTLMQHIYRFDAANMLPFPHRVVKIRDEFDQLIDALNDMQSSLQHSNHEIKKMQSERTDIAQQMASSEVTTSVMHDVNNILSSMNLIVLRTKRDAKVKSPAEILPALVREIESANTAMLKIIKAQQSLAAGRGDVWDSVTIDQIIQDAIAIEAYTLEMRHIVLTVTGAVDQWVVTRRFLVMSALVNCIKNARESLGLARTVNPTISINVSLNGDEIILRVKDNGLGAAAETLAKLKTRGFTTKVDGHGFGIDGCRKNMIALGGGLDIESEGLGLGATSIIRQPLDAKKFTETAATAKQTVLAGADSEDGETGDASGKVISLRKKTHS